MDNYQIIPEVTIFVIGNNQLKDDAVKNIFKSHATFGCNVGRTYK